MYVGHSKADVKKTLYRHFQLWTDIRQSTQRQAEGHDRVTYAGNDLSRYTIKVYYTNSGKDAEVLEQLLIGSIKPRDNISKLMMFAPKEYAAMADAAAEPDIVFETPDGEDWQPF
ncbi:MAG: hypothetical protein LCH58_06035 [Bacteroidetes bacterium]|uniref:hypothetical protein n=1 Tax=Phnomibacter sp. TaxID=2836217 RepID=UPI002FDE2091|nr:hypothetical protein [Bacteroidota bacterium]